MKKFYYFSNRMITPQTIFVLTTMAIMTTLLVASCGGTEEVAITVPIGAQSGDLVGLEPCIYKANQVEYEADCGTLVVPENRGDPNARLIALPITHVHALGENPSAPIFYYAGGPGGPNAKCQHLEGLVDNHDIVQVGYRGVDGSVVLDCPEVTRAIRDAKPDLLSLESLTNIGEAFTSCGARLEAEGIDLDGYTIIEKIEDNEAARVALGYERINLLGASYGTRLEQIYMWRYPESLHRVIMISVNPPGNMVWEPDYVDRLIEHDSELCAQDPECSARTDDLAKTIRNVVHNIPDRWMFFSIDLGMLRAISFLQLFHRGTAAQIYDAFLAAEGGDPSGLALGSLVGELIMPAVNTWGFSVSMGYSADFDPTRDYCTEMNPPNAILGAGLSEYYWCSAQHAEWPTDLIPEDYRQVQSSDIETLLVSGNADFSTPAWTATDELLPALNNAEQVILSEFGHTADIWSLQPEATRHLLTTFFETGEVDDSVFAYQPMSFDVGLMSFPFLAKVLVMAIILVPLLLVGLVWFIARSVKRRNASQISAYQIVQCGWLK
jgi:pimeloyl-ACP methyl ester carboxylesterase